MEKTNNFGPENPDEKLSNTYVEEYYDNRLKQLHGDYKTARWFNLPETRLDYEETKDSIEYVLDGVHAEHTLEIGPGDGVWTDLLIPKTKNLTLLDQSSEMIKRAKERLNKFTHITYVHSDFLNYVPDTKFDLLVGIRCFEYFDDKEHAGKKLSELVEKGGLLILVTKNPEHIKMKAVQRHRLHKGQLTKSDIRILLSENGFEVMHILPATFRFKAKYALLRTLSRTFHKLHVLLGSWFSIPFVTKWFTESYIYVARKKY